MRSVCALLWLAPLATACGCGPSDIEEAGRSFARFASTWAEKEFPGEPVLKETTQDVAVSDDSAFKTEKGYYRRRTTFEGLRFQVVAARRGPATYVGTLEGERVVRSTPVHASAAGAAGDSKFVGAHFAYPEKYVFECVHGTWRLRE